jgi:hypothetical protein
VSTPSAFWRLTLYLPKESGLNGESESKNLKGGNKLKADVKLGVEHMKVIVTTGNEEQRQTVNLNLKVTANIRDLARALYWQNNGAPLYVIIGSNQVELDLDIKPVSYQLELVPVRDDERPKPVVPETPVEQAINRKESSLANEAPAVTEKSPLPPEPEAKPRRRRSKGVSKVEVPTVPDAPVSIENRGNGSKSIPQCKNCGYYATETELEEQGEGLCPSCCEPLELSTTEIKA